MNITTIRDEMAFAHKQGSLAEKILGELKPEEHVEDGALKLILTKAIEKKVSDENIIAMLKNYTKHIEKVGIVKATEDVVSFLDKLNDKGEMQSATANTLNVVEVTPTSRAIADGIVNRADAPDERETGWKTIMSKNIAALVKNIRKCSAVVKSNSDDEPEEIKGTDAPVQKTLDGVKEFKKMLDDKSIQLSESHASTKDLDLEVKIR